MELCRAPAEVGGGRSSSNRLARQLVSGMAPRLALKLGTQVWAPGPASRLASWAPGLSMPRPLRRRSPRRLHPCPTLSPWFCALRMRDCVRAWSAGRLGWPWGRCGGWRHDESSRGPGDSRGETGPVRTRGFAGATRPRWSAPFALDPAHPPRRPRARSRSPPPPITFADTHAQLGLPCCKHSSARLAPILEAVKFVSVGDGVSCQEQPVDFLLDQQLSVRLCADGL